MGHRGSPGAEDIRKLVAVYHGMAAYVDNLDFGFKIAANAPHILLGGFALSSGLVPGRRG